MTTEEIKSFLDDFSSLARHHGLTLRGDGVRIVPLGPLAGISALRNPDGSMSLCEHLNIPGDAPNRIVSSVRIDQPPSNHERLHISARQWFDEHIEALQQEAEFIEKHGVPGSRLSCDDGGQG